MPHNRPFETSFAQAKPADKDDLFNITQAMQNVRLPVAHGKSEASKNRNIPAGYTYLAQFIAHDLNHSQLARTNFDVCTSPNPDDQPVAQLDLGHLYGGGPGESSLLFETETGTNARWRLVEGASVSPHLAQCTAAPNGALIHFKSQVESELGRDLPRRVRCPRHVNERLETDGAAIVGDPRNDENLVISQLTTLFIKAHNRIAKQVAKSTLAGLDAAARTQAASQVFDTARNMMIHAYHNIVLEDLNKRLLTPNIAKRLRAAFDNHNSQQFRFLGDPRRGFRVPLEFSRAAMRVGHTMAQDNYRVNVEFSDDHRQQDFEVPFLKQLIDIVRENAADRKLPLPDTWLIEWDRFFFDPDLVDPTSNRLPNFHRVNFSHPIGLSCAASLVSTKRGAFPTEDGKWGVPYMDLARAHCSGVRTAQQFMKVYPNLLLATDTASNGKQKLTIGQIKDALTDFVDDDRVRDQLARETPLYLYLLIEAQLLENGERLGPLGSRIVGEVLVGALMSAHLPKDAVGLRGPVVPPSATRQAAAQNWQDFMGMSAPTTMEDFVSFAFNKPNNFA